MTIDMFRITVRESRCTVTVGAIGVSLWITSEGLTVRPQTVICISCGIIWESFPQNTCSVGAREAQYKELPVPLLYSADACYRG